MTHVLILRRAIVDLSGGDCRAHAAKWATRNSQSPTAPRSYCKVMNPLLQPKRRSMRGSIEQTEPTASIPQPISGAARQRHRIKKSARPHEIFRAPAPVATAESQNDDGLTGLVNSVFRPRELRHSN
jgi:hypothetical protein